MRRWIQCCYLAIAVALGAIICGGPAPAARANFDGLWSVLIITDAGTCDRAYRYRLRIADGTVSYDGQEAGVQVSGQVDAKGRVTVAVRSGDQVAQGTGQLSQTDGEGQWSGRSPAKQCAGRWEAERRG